MRRSKTQNHQVRGEMKVYDVRPGIGHFDIDTHGFIVANLSTAMNQTLEVLFDPKETEIRSVYWKLWKEIEELAKLRFSFDLLKSSTA